MKIYRPEESGTFQPITELNPEQLAEAYALAKATFTAADLQKYAEPNDGIPMEPFLEELEQKQLQHEQKQP